MLKSVVELKIVPVGTPVCPAAAAGIVTVNACLTPSCEYVVAVPVPLLATQRMPVGPEGHAPRVHEIRINGD